MASLRSLKLSIYEREERKQQYQSHIRGLNAYERHKKFVQDYVEYYGKHGSNTEKLPIKTDQDTIREGYRFIPSEEDDMDSSWEKRLVKKYYDKLFKEELDLGKGDFTTAMLLSNSPSQMIGLRWRTEKEVISGRGQFICGNRECSEKDGLGSYEVNFSYFEAGETKQALVKLVACKRCAEKLVYKRRKDEEARAKETDKRKQKETESIEVKEEDKYKRKRDKIKGDDDSSDEYDRSPRKKGSRKKDGKSSDEYNRGSRKRGHKGLLDPKDAEDEEFDDFLEGMFP